MRHFLESSDVDLLWPHDSIGVRWVCLAEKFLILFEPIRGHRTWIWTKKVVWRLHRKEAISLAPWILPIMTINSACASESSPSLSRRTFHWWRSKFIFFLYSLIIKVMSSANSFFFDVNVATMDTMALEHAKVKWLILITRRLLAIDIWEFWSNCLRLLACNQIHNTSFINVYFLDAFALRIELLHCLVHGLFYLPFFELCQCLILCLAKISVENSHLNFYRTNSQVID